MERIIHRANGGQYPENSLEALEEMVQIDAEGIEIDIQLSKDDIPVVFHDPQLKRMTGRDSFVRELSVSELKSLSVRKNKSGKEGTIPTLEEAIEIVKGKKLFYIELKKGDVNRITESVLKVINKRLSTESFRLSSFDPKIIKAVKARNENIRTGYIFSNPFRYLMLHMIERRNGGFDQWHCGKWMMRTNIAEKAHSVGKSLFPWVVNSEKEMRRCIRKGADGIITDEIGLLNELLSE